MHWMLLPYLLWCVCYITWDFWQYPREYLQYYPSWTIISAAIAFALYFPLVYINWNVLRVSERGIIILFFYWLHVTITFILIVSSSEFFLCVNFFRLHDLLSNTFFFLNLNAWLLFSFNSSNALCRSGVNSLFGVKLL